MRETIAAVGGYWRPLAGLARLLEELGELAQDLTDAAGSAAIEAELADIWIISTALADQFLALVADPGIAFGRPAETQPALLELVAAAAPVARIVNYYDGPKTPRPGDELGSLNDAIARLHEALGLLAMTLDVDLARAVTRKLGAIGARDRGRFAPAAHDPSAAPVLMRFQEARGSSTTGAGASARLWGAPDPSDADPQARARQIARDLVTFTRAARPERIEGYVIELPAPLDVIGSSLVLETPSLPATSSLGARAPQFALVRLRAR